MGRDDSIKRFDSKSRDDCPLIENVPGSLERTRAIRAGCHRAFPIWGPFPTKSFESVDASRRRH